MRTFRFRRAKKSPCRFKFSLAVFFVCAPLALGALNARADGDPAVSQVPMQIPYAGLIERNGSGLSGSIEMSLTLYADASSATALWSERHTVMVYSGRFAILLGSISPESSAAMVVAIHGADDLHVGIMLHQDGQDIALQGRKRLVPQAYSLWSVAAADFRVNNDLTVVGNANVAGDLSTASLGVAGQTSTGSLSVAGHSATGSLGFASGAHVRGLRISGVYEAAVLTNPANWGGATVTNMSSTANSICFLARQIYSHNHARPETDVDTTDCAVYAEGGFWKVQAKTSKPWSTTHLSLTCRAHCLEWNW